MCYSGCEEECEEVRVFISFYISKCVMRLFCRSCRSSSLVVQLHFPSQYCETKKNRIGRG
jgi:hypothetical protein